MEGKPVNFEIKVGIFVFIGILAMFIIVFSIGKFYILKPTYNVNVVFGFANGVASGAPVRLAGVSVGEIEDIKINYDQAQKRTKILISAKIKKEAMIEKDAVFTINTLGLLGEKYVEITPGSPDKGFVGNGDTVIGVDPVQMEEVTKTMKELSSNAKAIMESAKVIVSRLEKGEGTVGKLLTEDKIYNDLEYFVSDIKRHPWKLLIKGKETPEEGENSPKVKPQYQSNIHMR